MERVRPIETCDAVVIGGGPSGLFASSLLSQNGIDTVLIEKDSEIGKDVVCSGVISKEAFERYDLPENAIVGTLQDAELHSPGGVNIPYSHTEKAVVVVDRHNFDGELGKISAKNGTKILLNTRVTSLSVKENYVEIDIKSLKEIRSIRSKVVIIATG